MVQDVRRRVVRRARGSGHLWQADHITPVIEGGGECGIENYRTLCTPCHKKETAELARRQAEKRKQERIAAVELPLLTLGTGGYAAPVPALPKKPEPDAAGERNA